MTILVGIYSEQGYWNLPPAHLAGLREAFPALTFLHARNSAEALALIPDAEIVFMSELRAPQFAAATRLRWVHSPAAGVGGMLFPEFVRSPVVLTNSRGLGAVTIAEHVLAVTLAMFRHLPRMLASQRDRVWAQADAFGDCVPRTIAGARMLVVGFGAIGREVARRFDALGADVTAVRRHATASGDVRVETPDRLHDLLPQADAVVIAAPLTRETRGLFGDRAFAAMRADALLVNVSRGRIVDEGALIRALTDRRIGGAALDVFEHEPLAPESPLWTMPNVLVTPHMAGFRTDHWDAVTDLFAENLQRFLAGRELLNVVDKTAGY